jgi:hypothetical protein
MTQVTEHLTSKCEALSSNLSFAQKKAIFKSYFFFAVLGFEFKPYALSHPTNPYFVKGFKLFAWEGLEFL